MGSSSAQEVVRRQSAGYGVVVSLAGLAVSGQLVASHVLHIASPLCELSSFASCERVLSSSYATLLGVPVALFGALFFLFSFWLCVRCAGPSASPTRSLQDTAAFAAGLLWIAVAGVASVVYFVYAEWQIGALCPLCTVVHVLCVALLVLAIRIHRNAPLPSHFSLHPLHVAQLAWHLRSEAVVFIALLIAPIFFVALWSAPPAPKYDEHKLRTFASCLSQRGFTLYVRQGCGYCQMQKALFGDALSALRVVDCAEREEECKEIHAVPMWERKSRSGYAQDSSHKGFQSIEKLAQISSCPEPKS